VFRCVPQQCSSGCVKSRGYLCSVNTGFRISNSQTLFFAVGNFRQDCTYLGLAPWMNFCFSGRKELGQSVSRCFRKIANGDY